MELKEHPYYQFFELIKTLEEKDYQDIFEKLQTIQKKKINTWSEVFKCAGYPPVTGINDIEDAIKYCKKHFQLDSEECNCNCHCESCGLDISDTIDDQEINKIVNKWIKESSNEICT